MLVTSNTSPAGATITISADDFTGRIAAGELHTCAIADDDSVWCWGDNNFGQLGDSNFLDEKYLFPIEVNIPNGVVPMKITAGFHHTCALDSDHKVWCLSLIHI